jgi:hypothetical protein
MKTAIITTTINIPRLLEDYVKNIKRYGHDCFFVIIGDKKTPPETKDYCNKIKREYRTDVQYLDVNDQILYLKRFPELNRHLVYNSIQRRNIALIFAYEQGAETIITIDDDNFILNKDFVRLHSVGQVKEMEVIFSNTKWFNVCDYLKERYGRRIYHRGFPQEYRFLKEKIKIRRKKIRIVANAGFWLGEPDVDALTRLYFANQCITAIGYPKKNNFALDKNTWSPFNSQNTSLAREIVPAYFLSPYIGRYDDIWASYVIRKITDYFGHYVSYGQPMVKQKRNPHNLWKDLKKEDDGMRLTGLFTQTLRKIRLTENSYKTCFGELSCKLQLEFDKENLGEGDRDFLFKYFEGMEIWAKTFKRISG